MFSLFDDMRSYGHREHNLAFETTGHQCWYSSTIQQEMVVPLLAKFPLILAANLMQLGCALWWSLK